MAEIFVSYAREDKDFVQMLYRALQQRNATLGSTGKGSGQLQNGVRKFFEQSKWPILSFSL
jgi:hypothetical protein